MKNVLNKIILICIKKFQKDGEKINKLTFIKEVPKPNNRNTKGTYGLWKCDCGQQKIINISSVRNKEIISCGCELLKVQKQIHDITGQRFGMLVALYPTDKQLKDGRTFWHCRCDCGNEKDICIGNLTAGRSWSCGCLSSRHNSKISQLLSKAKISFEQEKRFKDLKDIYNLVFDFYVDNKYIIEFDGIQHFDMTEHGWNTLDKFNTRHKHDLMKNKYCFDNNIPLIRIPYDANYSLKDLQLDSTRWLFTKEVENDYYESRGILSNEKI